MQPVRTLAERWLDEEASKSSSTSAVLSQVFTYLFLFLLIFGLSATVDLKSLKHQFTNRKALGSGLGMQFIVMPLLGFLSVMTFRNVGLTYAMGLTLMVVTTSPGGSYSNWWCSLFNAELALSVAMTTSSSILSLGFLPANLLLYTYFAYSNVDQESVVGLIDFNAIFVTLGIVISAIVTGILAGNHWDSRRFHVWAHRLGSLSGICLILVSLFLSSGVGGATSTFWNQPWAFYLGVGLPCVVGMLLSTVVARSIKLSDPETVAIAIESCYQNTGIATSMAIGMFTNVDERAQAVAVPLFYGVVEAVSIGIYCIVAWKMGWTKAPANEKLCVVLTTTYEVEDEHSLSGTETDDTSLEQLEQGRSSASSRVDERQSTNVWANAIRRSSVAARESKPRMRCDSTTTASSTATEAESTVVLT